NNIERKKEIQAEVKKQATSGKMRILAGQAWLLLALLLPMWLVSCSTNQHNPNSQADSMQQAPASAESTSPPLPSAAIRFEDAWYNYLDSKGTQPYKYRMEVNDEIRYKMIKTIKKK